MRFLFALLLALGVWAADFDVLIRNGRVIDGAGNPWFRADFGLRDGRIAALGNLSAASAGRVIDADEGAFGAIRVMVNCNQTGQAAGVAAAMVVKTGKPVAEVDVPQMLKVLKDQGAVIVGNDE